MHRKQKNAVVVISIASLNYVLRIFLLFALNPCLIAAASSTNQRARRTARHSQSSGAWPHPTCCWTASRSFTRQTQRGAVVSGGRESSGQDASISCRQYVKTDWFVRSISCKNITSLLTTDLEAQFKFDPMLDVKPSVSSQVGRQVSFPASPSLSADLKSHTSSSASDVKHGQLVPTVDIPIQPMVSRSLVWEFIISMYECSAIICSCKHSVVLYSKQLKCTFWKCTQEYHRKWVRIP